MTKITKQLSAKLYRWFAAFALVAICGFSSVAQITTSVTMSAVPIAGSPFASFGAAITAVNGLAITGPVVVDATAGQTETAPAGVLTGGGGYIITATGTVTNTITIQRTGVGANPTLTAAATLVAGNLNDGIIKIHGGDYITIDGFTMLENPANTTTAAATNNMTEWGVALLYATSTNGAQNCTIKNCTIDLNRTYQNTFGIYSNSTHTTTNVTTSASATTTAGGNSGLTITSNTITDVNNGIVVVGPTAAADFNTGVVIGGSALNANTITNYGTTGTFSGYVNVSGTVNGILVRNSNGFNITHNSITSSAGGTTVGTLNGIQIPAASATPTTTFTNNITNNAISLQSGNSTGAINGITYPSGSASTTSVANINSNNFTQLNHSVATSGTIIGITIASTNLTTSISSNTFTNLTTNTTGSFTFISHSYTIPAAGTATINSNSIVTAFNKTGAGGTVTLTTTNGSSGNTATLTQTGNNFSNITVTGATAITGFNNTDGLSSSPGKTITGNTLSNWTGGTSAITAMNYSYWGLGTPNTLSSNNIANITGQAAVTGISINSSANGTNTLTFASNTISNLTSTGTGGAVTGIVVSNTSTLININNNAISTLASTGASAVTGISRTGASTTDIFKNTICDLSGSNASSTVNGILVSAGTTVSVSNNRIGDLRTPNANAANPLNGINITGGTTVNAYYNTVYLNGSSSGALFGSSALSVSTTPTFTSNNNNLVNSSTTAGAGLAVAYRRSTTTISTYGATSDRNNYSASTIFFDGTTAYTFPGFKTLVGPARDANSVNEAPTFLSTTCGSANFLKIDQATPTLLESSAINIAGITDDFENEVRQGNGGYAGTSTFAPDIGADEFNGTNPSLCSGTPVPGTISSSGALCSGTGTTLSLTGNTSGLGISYQWRAYPVSGGPYVNLGTASTQATGNLAGTMYYVVTLTCANGGASATTPEFTQTVNPAQATSVTPSSIAACAGVNTPLLANSESYTVTGTLQGSQEVPPTGSLATGTVNAVYNGVTNVLTINVAYNGLTGTVTAAHIHGPAPAGANAGVLYGLTPSIVALGGASGNLTGTVTLSAADEASLYAGLLYVNIHTSAFGGGEVRAQLTAVVNTPSAYLWSPNVAITSTTVANPTVNPTSNQTYTVQVTGTGGCTATNTTAITALPNPTIGSFVASPNSVCFGTGFNLVATGSGSVQRGTISANSGAISVPTLDNSATGVTTTLALSGANGNLAATDTVQVGFSITHTFDGDLDIFLVGPSNCGTLELSTDNGSTGDNYTNTIVLTPSANTLISLGSAPFTGTFTPEKTITQTPTLSGAGPAGGGTYTLPATALAGCPVNGTWTLFVGDDASGDNGAITNFDLSIKTDIPGNYIHAFSGNGTIGSVSYSGPNGETGTAAVSSVPVGSNTYTVITTAVNGCTATTTTNASVEATPTANAGADANACATGYVLTGAVGGSATGGTWTTSGDGTFSPNATTLGATYIAGPNDITNGTVTLTLTSTGSVACAAASDNVTLTVYAGVPTTPTPISGAPVSVCPPAGPFTISTTSVGATSYNWYLAPGNNGVTFLTANGSNTIDVDFQATTNSGYTIRVEASNVCGTSSFTSVFVRRSTSVPTAVIGDGFACPNNVKTYSHAAVGGATSYQWTAPAGCYFDGVITNTPPYVTTNTSVTVTFPPGYTGGVIGVASQVACFTSAYKNITVNNAPSLPGVITGSAAVCPPQAGVAYSVTNTPGLTYTWTAPANATIFSGQGTNSVTVNYAAGFAGGQLQVVANSACGTSAARKLNVTITGGGGGTTPRPTSITGTTANLCGSTAVVYTANPFVAGATYNFSTTVPGALVTPGPGTNQATITWPTGWVNGTLSVTQQNPCGALVSLPRTVDIKSKPGVPVITGPVNVAPNSVGVAYSVPALSNPTVTYTWYVPAGATIASGQGTNAITVNFGPTGGQVKCLEVNSCGNATGVLNVSIPRLAGTASKAEEAISFSVFPNPADEYVTVQFAAVTEGNATVQIIDLRGKVVSSTVISTVEGINTNTIEVSTLAKGMYIMNVQTPDGNVQTRIAVQ